MTKSSRITDAHQGKQGLRRQTAPKQTPIPNDSQSEISPFKELLGLQHTLGNYQLQRTLSTRNKTIQRYTGRCLGVCC